ncbi:MAG: solute carrier family 23 protein [Eubacteriales bacterium]|jgi:uracil permease|nr:solute carrier family 23 protein [Eubacteriales bacterium]MDD4105732.1 solute carrier family 23 protein [Eubacteriales bacterium]MDD4710956.1 solute carrier family 23 protein [Eubacteriales bacterium]NLO15471.1 xanthine permease [Clostridiales bacterium]
MSQTSKQGYSPKPHAEASQVVGYLPDERPPIGRLLLYALQQVIVMFPATVTVALITGFHVSTTIFASGLATVCFTLITGRKIPMYYGSSFAYLAAIASMVAAEGSTEQLAQLAATGILPTELISKAQFGIIMSGFISIIAGLLVRWGGMDKVEKILPPTVTGPIAMIIGLTLAANAMKDAAPQAGQPQVVWIVSLITLLSTVIYSRKLKGFLGQLPLLLGAATGCLTALVLYLIGGESFFRTIPAETLAASSWKLGEGAIFALPAFSWPTANWAAVAAIMPIAIATIPESTAHMYQLDIYVNDLARRKGKPSYGIANMLDRNLVGDGICDMISGAVGGPAGTNYGENISTMAITKVFSVRTMFVAGILAMVIGCFTPLIRVIYGIPLAVIGGLEIYLFGAIAAQGIAILIDKKVSMFDAKNIAVIASIVTIGLGINYGFGGNIVFFGVNVPAVAGAAIFGILLNLILSIGDKKTSQATE